MHSKIMQEARELVGIQYIKFLFGKIMLPTHEPWSQKRQCDIDKKVFLET